MTTFPPYERATAQPADPAEFRTEVMSESWSETFEVGQTCEYGWMDGQWLPCEIIGIHKRGCYNIRYTSPSGLSVTATSAPSALRRASELRQLPRADASKPQ